jgi:hypothetical protein
MSGFQRAARSRGDHGARPGIHRELSFVAAVPLALGLPLYAVIFSVLDAVLLRERIRVENAALAWASF